MAKKIKLNYVNNDSPVIMTITEFDCLDVYYNWWKNSFKGKLVVCKECGKLILEKNINARTKYCKDCAKRINIEKTNGLR